MNDIEFDTNKSLANLKKHGIDFKSSQEIFEDPELVMIDAKLVGKEKRTALIGEFSDKLWTMIVTFRKDSIRIISVRRSRPEEVALYEHYKSE